MQGIAGHGFYDTCVVPIIENTARERELTDRLQVGRHSGSSGSNMQGTVSLYPNHVHTVLVNEPAGFCSRQVALWVTLLAVMQAAIKAYPKSSAVLVRRHGIYVWGPNWVAAKSQVQILFRSVECAGSSPVVTVEQSSCNRRMCVGCRA